MLLVISLDSESLGWLDEHIDSGYLPNLRHLVRSGSRFPLVTPPFEGSVYPTVYSGLRPADHGLYYPFQWSASEQRIHTWDNLPFPRTIFEQADQAGTRIVVLDPPECQPVKLQRGFAASGIQFRARVLLHSWSSDSVVSSRLQRPVGPAPRASEVFGQPHVAGLTQLRTALLGAPARLEAAAMHFLRTEPVDCLWLNCCAFHLAAHQFFDLGLLKNPQDRRALESTRLDVARGHDAMIGRVMEALPAGSDVVVFYAKGMVPVNSWVDLLPSMLRSILGEASSEQPVSHARRLVPQRLRAIVADALPDSTALAITAQLYNPRVDWRRTRAFVLPSEGPGLIRLNVRGRERDGCVAESEVAGLIDEIRDGLQRFTDLEGERVVCNVPTIDQLLEPGKYSNRFADLMVQWAPKPNLLGLGVRSPKSGEIRRLGVGSGRSGTHGPGALAVVTPGRCRFSSVAGEAYPEDIPVTVLAALGLPFDGLPGRPLLVRT